MDDVSFELERGECLGIVGESGSGKSTIAQMITHLEPATEGRIFLKEQDITHARGKALRDIYQDVQMVFQMPMESFDPRCTLGDGIGESLRNMGISRDETRKTRGKSSRKMRNGEGICRSLSTSGQRWSVPESCDCQSACGQSGDSDL